MVSWYVALFLVLVAITFLIVHGGINRALNTTYAFVAIYNLLQQCISGVRHVNMHTRKCHIRNIWEPICKKLSHNILGAASLSGFLFRWTVFINELQP